MIFKFGGASIKDAESIQNVGQIILNSERPLLVVFSALGKTTNALEEVVNLYFKDRSQSMIKFRTIVDSHLQLAKAIQIDLNTFIESINEIVVSVDWLLEIEPEDPYDYVYDQIVSVGELLSSKLLAAYLSTLKIDDVEWLDIRDVIITNDQYRDPKVLWDMTMRNVETYLANSFTENKLIITQGFLGSTTDNNTTTLGREGSDYTGAILSYCLGVDHYTIWKDVPGVLTGDPKIFDNVTKIDQLSYEEAIEMTYYGAKVIHPKTIKPLQNKSIELEVKSFNNPSANGTIVSNKKTTFLPPIVVVEPGQALIHFSTNDFSFIAENHLKDIFEALAENRIRVNLMRNTAISFTICVTDFEDRIDHLTKSIDSLYSVDVQRGLELITIRHYNDSIVQNLKGNRVVLFEERLESMMQMVVKNIATMSLKD